MQAGSLLFFYPNEKCLATLYHVGFVIKKSQI